MRRLLIWAILVAFLAVIPGVFPSSTSAGGPRAAVLNLTGCTDSTLDANDDGSTSAVGLPYTLNFFGSNYSSLYVNNNGNVTFDVPQATYTPFSLLSTTRVIIAPFFADVDTRGKGSGLVQYGATTYAGRTAFCVNWINVGYFSRHVDRLNSFQLVLVDRSDIGVGDFDIIFNYDRVQWETGDASGGEGGLGGSSARAGYTNGVDASLELPGSALNGALLDSSAGGLANNSRDSQVTGRYIFAVRSGAAPTGGVVSGRVFGEPQKSGENVPLAGAPVQICRQDVVPPICSTTTTNASGEYIATGLPAGTYNGIAVPPAERPDLFPDINDLFELGNNQMRADYDFKLTRPRPLPPGVTVDSIAHTSTGAPVINWAIPVQITTVNDDCAGGSGTWELIKDGEVIASGAMNATATPGLFKGTIPPLRPEHGPAVIHIEMSCPGAGVDKELDVDVYIDPSGIVRTVQGAPIAGAVVTLYRSDSSSGPFDLVPNGSAVMSPSNRNNPDTTDDTGYFHWDVIAGFYKVRAQSTGCHAPGNPGQDFVETGVLTIPPPVTDLDLRLDCGGTGPTATPPGPTATRPPGATPTSPAIRFGDVNCDGTVNSIDAALVLQRSAGLVGSLACQAAADVNEDGTINSIDAAIILQFAAGLIDSLPV